MLSVRTATIGPQPSTFARIQAAADKFEAEFEMFARLQLGPVIEAVLFVVVTTWAVQYVNDVNHGVGAYLQVCGADSLPWGCAERKLPWGSILGLVLFGALFLRLPPFGAWAEARPYVPQNV
jgi:hypothetical protein